MEIAFLVVSNPLKAPSLNADPTESHQMGPSPIRGRLNQIHLIKGKAHTTVAGDTSIDKCGL